jgi:hypothetical protein
VSRQGRPWLAHPSHSEGAVVEAGTRTVGNELATLGLPCDTLRLGRILCLPSSGNGDRKWERDECLRSEEGQSGDLDDELMRDTLGRQILALCGSVGVETFTTGRGGARYHGLAPRHWGGQFPQSARIVHLLPDPNLGGLGVKECLRQAGSASRKDAPDPAMCPGRWRSAVRDLMTDRRLEWSAQGKLP